jgi:hypothetical protein
MMTRTQAPVEVLYRVPEHGKAELIEGDDHFPPAREE